MMGIPFCLPGVRTANEWPMNRQRPDGSASKFRRQTGAGEAEELLASEISSWGRGLRTAVFWSSPVVPFNFVSTCDIRRNSPGSPTVNTKGELVGIVFDGNIKRLLQ